jgi:hypothetical protein
MSPWRVWHESVESGCAEVAQSAALSLHERGVNPMQATKLLQEQFRIVGSNFRATIADITDQEWTARSLPGMNPPGWTLWHVTRTLDAVVHTVIQGVPEIITQARWASCGALTTPGVGLGQTLEEAHALAHAINRTDVTAYAEVVLPEALAWIATLRDDDLDAAPDLAAHVAGHPIYQVPDILEAVGMPVWAHLLVNCLLHSQDHVTEVVIIKQQLRLPAPSSPRPRR